MGFQRENFVGNPNKQEYVDEDDELEYLSGDEIDFNPFGLVPGDPDMLLVDNYDIVTESDEDYDPEDDYEDYLSDSDYEYDGGDGSEEEGSEPVFSDADQDEVPAATTENQESSDKGSADNKTVENKITDEVRTNGMDGVSSNETDAGT